MTDINFEELLAQTAIGNRRAFEQLYKSSSSHLYAVLLRICGQPDIANDALQEAYVQIWQKASEFNPDIAKPLTWMSSIARYRALDMLRAQTRRNRDRADSIEPETVADENSTVWQSQYDNAQTLDRCLATLSDDSRAAIQLAYTAGYTHDEIAAKMDKPLGTVKAWIRRGLLKLKDCVEGAESTAC